MCEITKAPKAFELNVSKWPHSSFHFCVSNDESKWFSSALGGDILPVIAIKIFKYPDSYELASINFLREKVYFSIKF